MKEEERQIKKSGKRLGDSEERLDLPSKKKRRTHLRGGNKKRVVQATKKRQAC